MFPTSFAPNSGIITCTKSPLSVGWHRTEGVCISLPTRMNSRALSCTTRNTLNRIVNMGLFYSNPGTLPHALQSPCGAECGASPTFHAPQHISNLSASCRSAARCCHSSKANFGIVCLLTTQLTLPPAGDRVESVVPICLVYVAKFPPT